MRIKTRHNQSLIMIAPLKTPHGVSQEKGTHIILSFPKKSAAKC